MDHTIQKLACRASLFIVFLSLTTFHVKAQEGRSRNIRLLGGGPVVKKTRYDPGMKYCKEKKNELDKNKQTVCSKCKDGYRLRSMGYGCSQCHYKCKQCAGLDFFCTECPAGAVLDSKKGWCHSCGKGCEICDLTDVSSKTCQKCKPGFFKNTDNKCSPCLALCEKCKSKHTCDACFPGKKLLTFSTGRQKCQMKYEHSMFKMLSLIGFFTLALIFSALCCFSIFRTHKDRFSLLEDEVLLTTEVPKKKEEEKTTITPKKETISLPKGVAPPPKSQEMFLKPNQGKLQQTKAFGSGLIEESDPMDGLNQEEEKGSGSENVPKENSGESQNVNEMVQRLEKEQGPSTQGAKPPSPK